jgi:hypothetical protein
VAAVDPDDDSILRYVIRHYRYDPDRHERRHVVVAAFDSQSEFEAVVDAIAAALRARREAGEDVDPREYISGLVYEPGYRRLQQNARLIRRAIQHRVVPPNWQELELPPSVSVTQAGLP